MDKNHRQLEIDWDNLTETQKAAVSSFLKKHILAMTLNIFFFIFVTLQIFKNPSFKAAIFGAFVTFLSYVLLKSWINQELAALEQTLLNKNTTSQDPE